MALNATQRTYLYIIPTTVVVMTTVLYLLTYGVNALTGAGLGLSAFLSWRLGANFVASLNEDW